MTQEEAVDACTALGPEWKYVSTDFFGNYIALKEPPIPGFIPGMDGGESCFLGRPDKPKKERKKK